MLAFLQHHPLCEPFQSLWVDVSDSLWWIIESASCRGRPTVHSAWSCGCDQVTRHMTSQTTRLGYWRLNTCTRKRNRWIWYMINQSDDLLCKLKKRLTWQDCGQPQTALKSGFLAKISINRGAYTCTLSSQMLWERSCEDSCHGNWWCIKPQRCSEIRLRQMARRGMLLISPGPRRRQWAQDLQVSTS